METPAVRRHEAVLPVRRMSQCYQVSHLTSYHGYQLNDLLKAPAPPPSIYQRPECSGQFLLSPDFFLDTSGCVAKMSISALSGLNADMLISKSPNLRVSHSDGVAVCVPAGQFAIRQFAIRLPSLLASRIFEG